MANIVAIVGRPNVGKSTFFNRMVERRDAIMDNMPGVTRDRHYGYAEWVGKFFTVIDTGGYVTGSDDKFESQIRRQVELAVEEATAIIFMVDCRDGLTGYDKEFANILRRYKKPVFIAANKADTPDKAILTAEFYELGLGEVYPVSAGSGGGTGELLDEVVKVFETEDVEDPNAGIPKIAILGRPNVGKSSFLNVLLGQERSIVTDEAGTTRDAIHSRYTMFQKDFILIDTAGIRKRSKVHEVSSRRCSVVSPAFDSRSSFCACRRRRKNSRCLSFMYSLSGMASSSASVSSRADLVFQALASFGSGLVRVLTTSCISSCPRTGARAGAKRSVNRLVSGRGAGSGMGCVCDAARDAAFGAALTVGAATAALAGAALAGTFFAAVAALLASVLFNWGLLAGNLGARGL